MAGYTKISMEEDETPKCESIPPQQAHNIRDLHSGANIIIKNNPDAGGTDEEAIVTTVFEKENVFQAIRLTTGSTSAENEFTFKCNCMQCTNDHKPQLQQTRSDFDQIVTQSDMDFNKYLGRLWFYKTGCYPLSQVKRRADFFLHKRYIRGKQSSEVMKEISSGAYIDAQYVKPSTNAESFPLTCPNLYMAACQILSAGWTTIKNCFR